MGDRAGNHGKADAFIRVFANPLHMLDPLAEQAALRTTNRAAAMATFNSLSVQLLMAFFLSLSSLVIDALFMERSLACTC